MLFNTRSIYGRLQNCLLGNQKEIRLHTDDIKALMEYGDLQPLRLDESFETDLWHIGQYKHINNIFEKSLKDPIGTNYFLMEKQLPRNQEARQGYKYMTKFAYEPFTSVKGRKSWVLVTKSDMMSPDELIQYVDTLGAESVSRKAARYGMRTKIKEINFRIPDEYEGGEYDIFRLVQRHFLNSDLDVDVSYIMGDNKKPHMIKVYYYGKKIPK